MMRKKRTEITIETDRTIVISRRSFAARAWCGACDKQVSLVTIDEAARLASVSTRTLFRWVEAENVHFTETSDGRLFICCQSIPQPGNRPG